MSLWYDEQALLKRWREDLSRTQYGALDDPRRWNLPEVVQLNREETRIAPYVPTHVRYGRDSDLVLARVVRRLRDFGMEWKQICWVWGYKSPSHLMLLCKRMLT